MRVNGKTIGKTLRTAGFLATLVLIGGTVWIAWQWGQFDRNNELSASGKQFQVAGGSMVPTYFGPHVQAKCPDCQRVVRVDIEFDQTLPRDRGCTLCGAELEATGDPVLGDIVSLTDSGSVEVGDVVAVRWDGQLRLKRVVGVPSNTISFDERKDEIAPRLFLNNDRMEDAVAASDSQPKTLVVDDDQLRVTSRWRGVSPTSLQTPGGRDWNRDKDSRRWHSRGSGWLVYTHEAVRKHLKLVGIQDDYQFNVGVGRQLNHVDRYALECSITCNRPVRIEVAFWTEDADVVTRANVRHSRSVWLQSSDGSPDQDLPVSQSQPVAIRILDQNATLSRLMVRRMIEYRLRTTDDRSVYPLTLAKGEYFVLGDNVPVSVDSRDVGPVLRHQIIGVVKEK